jgi:hypothetical protein
MMNSNFVEQQAAALVTRLNGSDPERMGQAYRAGGPVRWSTSITT